MSQTFKQNYEEKLVPLITTRMKKYNVTGVSIAVVEDGKLVWTHGFGWADKENGIAVTPDTLFKNWFNNQSVHCNGSHAIGGEGFS